MSRALLPLAERKLQYCAARNTASSPALSLDRLFIRYGGGNELMVSPADKAGFMTEIKKQLKR